MSTSQPQRREETDKNQNKEKASELIHNSVGLNQPGSPGPSVHGNLKNPCECQI
jgi:hypothetical protein